MLVDAKIFRTQYQPGTELDSRQSRDLIGTESAEHLTVGSTFIVPENFVKIRFVEQLGPLTIDRWFVKTDPHQKEMFPIYIKLYDSTGAHILMYLKGIGESLKNNGGFGSQAEFLKTKLFDSVATELTGRDAGWYDIYDHFYMSEWPSTQCNNDEVTRLPNTDKDVGYPWNLCYVESNMSSISLQQLDAQQQQRTERLPQSIADRIQQLHLHVARPDNPDYYGSLYDSVCKEFTTDTGDAYAPYTYDQLTNTCMTEYAVTGTSILDNAGILLPKKIVDLAINQELLQKEKYQPVTRFTSELLELCVFMHQQPMRELHLNYILPTRGSRGLFEVTYYKDCSRTDDYWKMEIQEFLSKLCSRWDPTINQISLMMFATDELVCVIGNKVGVQKWYIDLTITTMLSQGIVRF